MATRPLDRLTSIRVKLGSVIVFAVAVTILVMYVAVGFALHRRERVHEFSELIIEAKAVSALGFSQSGRPSASLLRAIADRPGVVVVVDREGRPLVGDFRVPSTVNASLAGHFDLGVIGNEEYVGVPVTRSGAVIGAVYLAHRREGGGLTGAIEGTASFVRSVWWQLLLAGAIAAFIALFLARILARGMTQPLRDMAHAAGAMTRGDYRQRVRARSRDEVGQLATAFNRMAGEMEGLERLRRDLVANVSHELKTPISALRARLENLLDGVEQPDPLLIGVMLQQTERLSRLVDQLLDLSRLESGDLPLEIEPVQLAPLVERVVGEVEVARGDREIHVRNLVPDDLPPVEGDRERIHQVLFNLVDNALRFTSQGGEVTVRATREDGSCEVSVEDTGPGIPPEHLPLVFERFYRVDPSRSREDGGTGIGLAIARSVVEAHGGRIWAESRVGVGSRFRFVLPTGRAPTGSSLGLPRAPGHNEVREPAPVPAMPGVRGTQDHRSKEDG
jgi:signal transduction histidine kinase